VRARCGAQPEVFAVPGPGVSQFFWVTARVAPEERFHRPPAADFFRDAMEMDMIAPAILDPASGSRMFYFNKEDQRVLFGDIRYEAHVLCDGRTLEVKPTMLMDFTALPFADDQFRMVIFDPPHIARAGPQSWQAKKYGKLTDDWRDHLRGGFSECFRVLAPFGTLVFKWNETQIPVSQVLALTPERPVCGNKKASKTHWLVFLKGGQA